jgi:uncharacterized protein (TIGR02145 family)
VNHLGGEDSATGKLKNTETWLDSPDQKSLLKGTNESGFGAITNPYITEYGQLWPSGIRASWSTSTDNSTEARSVCIPTFVIFDGKENIKFEENSSVGTGLGVRCVKD